MIKKAMILLIGLVFLMPAVQASPALTIKDTECALLASDGSPFMGTGHYVINKNWIILTCTGTQPVQGPNFNFNGFNGWVNLNYANTGMDYWTDYGTSQVWDEIIDPLGQVILFTKIPN